MPAAKRRKLSPPEDLDRPLPPSSPPEDVDIDRQGDYVRFGTGWNLEQNYEQRPRKQKREEENSRLPIKTAEGRIEQFVRPLIDKDDEDSFLGTSSDEETDSEGGLQGEEPYVSTQSRVIEAKEELARVATLLNQDPEEHVGGFRILGQIASSPDPAIKKLALATQLIVYKDVIPGYRIRLHEGAEVPENLSKDVRRLRSFEQALVGSYQKYVKDLASYGTGSKADAPKPVADIASVAISCASNLLLKVPHFNFRSELLKILIDRVSSNRRDLDHLKCVSTLETLFRDDEDGNPSLDGVSQLAKMIKARDYRVDESVLNTFLHLRLLSEFTSKGSQNRIDRYQGAASKISGIDGKTPKAAKKQFLTKKQRKLLREQKAVEKEFKEADAIVGYEERDRLQAETLKIVFVTYFRILKARVPHLMGVVLEGLAKYAHLINQDFFADLLEALRDLVRQADERLDAAQTDAETERDIEAPSSGANGALSTHDPNRASLLATTTAFTLLEGQDAARAASSLSLDLTFFIAHLYKSLHALSLYPDLELSSKSLRLPDPDSPPASQQPGLSNNKINFATPSVLLLRALSAILTRRSVPPVRLAAFTKQLLTVSIHFPERSAQAVLQLLTQVLKIHGSKVASLWNTEERKGDGVFDSERADVEGSNPFASTAWEGELLKSHFCPKVREGVKGVEKIVRGVGK
ncbi:MAG: hypothetical protein LQ351_005175 [Letrouitia transgressa]|nr:MAG: hypothetical protein LQ351_005175 [Letrouitia transgressa]